jgi:hypothetical protein
LLRLKSHAKEADIGDGMHLLPEAISNDVSQVSIEYGLWSMTTRSTPVIESQQSDGTVVYNRAQIVQLKFCPTMRNLTTPDLVMRIEGSN